MPSNMLVPATEIYAIVILSNTPQNDLWKPGGTTVEMYNEAKLGPKLPTSILFQIAGRTDRLDGRLFKPDSTFINVAR